MPTSDTPDDGARHLNRILIGLLLVFAAVAVLWYWSPVRMPLAEPNDAAMATFSVLFALGFVIGAVGLLGYERDYPALLSATVLYFLVGGLLAVFRYVREEGVGPWVLDSAEAPSFWTAWLRFAAFWPYELVEAADFLGY